MVLIFNTAFKPFFAHIKNDYLAILLGFILYKYIFYGIFSLIIILQIKRIFFCCSKVIYVSVPCVVIIVDINSDALVVPVDLFFTLSIYQVYY